MSHLLVTGFLTGMLAWAGPGGTPSAASGKKATASVSSKQEKKGSKKEKKEKASAHGVKKKASAHSAKKKAPEARVRKGASRSSAGSKRATSRQRASSHSQKGKKRWVAIPVRYANGYTLARLVGKLLGRQGWVRYERKLNTLFARGEGSWLQQVRKVVQRFDKPQRQFRLRVYLILASRVKKTPPIPKENSLRQALLPVLKLFRYNKFQLLDVAFVQCAHGQVAEMAVGGRRNLNLRLRPHHLGEQIRLWFELSRRNMVRQKNKVIFIKKYLIRTRLFTQSGHTVVVGASRLNGGEQALITVLRIQALR